MEAPPVTIRAALPALAAFLLLAPASALAEDDPVAAALALYEGGWQVLAADEARRDALLHPRFAEVVEAHARLDPAQQLAYDPLTGTLDPTVSDIEATLLLDADTRYVVEVSFGNAGSTGTTRLIFRKADDGVQLANIKYSDERMVREEMAAKVKAGQTGEARPPIAGGPT